MRPFYRKDLFRDEIIKSMSMVHDVKIDKEEMKLEILKMEKGQSITLNSEEYEIGMVILAGNTTIQTEHFIAQEIGARKDVFSGKPAAVYMPCQTTFEIKATGYGILEIALCKAKTDRKGEPFVVGQEDVRMKEKGVFNWKRKVHEIFINENPESTQHRLVIGETYGCPGQWATYPYTEDEQMGVFYFKVSPSNTKKLHVMQNPENSNQYYIENETAIVVQGSYAPVAEAEDYEVYYLWFKMNP